MKTRKLGTLEVSELGFGCMNLATNYGNAAPIDDAIKVIRDTKEKEIALAESSRSYILSIRKMKDYQRLKRVLAASVYAMTNGKGPRDLESESITGPIQ